MSDDIERVRKYAREKGIPEHEATAMYRLRELLETRNNDAFCTGDESLVRVLRTDYGFTQDATTSDERAYAGLLFKNRDARARAFRTWNDVILPELRGDA